MSLRKRNREMGCSLPRKRKLAIAAVLMSVLLTACGGGGGLSDISVHVLQYAVSKNSNFVDKASRRKCGPRVQTLLCVPGRVSPKLRSYPL